MNYINRRYIIFWMIILCSSYGLNGYNNPPVQIISISIPKCGTYLIAKCFSHLTGRVGVRKGPDDVKYQRKYILNGYSFTVTDNDFEYLTHLPYDKFWFPHLLPMAEYIEKFARRADIALFFIYRDPRDQVVSLMHHIRRLRARKDDSWKEEADALSDDELLTAAIQGCKLHVTDNQTETHIFTTDVNTRYRTYLKWLDVPGVHATRFEDLIGAEGGGSREAQHQEIRNIALHMGVILDNEAVDHVTKKIKKAFLEKESLFDDHDDVQHKALFGDSVTFHKGQIGAWKNEFTENHKKLFKEIAGQLLIDLGYEKDYNW